MRSQFILVAVSPPYWRPMKLVVAAQERAATRAKMVAAASGVGRRIRS
jgi:hypothetical protein